MREDYLISEPPLRALAVFAAPMILGNLFQQTYTMADSAIVGRFVGEQALGAVGASMALTNIFICVAIGGGNGASVIVSRLFGGRKIGPMKAAVYTALTAFLALSVLLGGFGLWMDRRILLALNTPADVMDMAVTYLDIYFLGLPFLFMYNVLSSMFNALGRSRIPLGFLIFSSVFNVILDWVAVAHLHMGVAGAAWATLIAQGVSALLSFGVLLRLLGRMEGAGRRFAPDQLLPMARIALPSILQQSTVSIGMMLVQSVVNSFGSQALAGFSAGMRIESMCVVPMSGIGNAVATFTAQNMGADRQERVVQGWRASLKLVALCAAVICLILELGNRQIIGLFLAADSSPLALSTGRDYLAFLGWFFALIGLKMAADGLLRGAGDMPVFTLANLLNLCIRVVIAKVMAPRLGIAWVWYAIPVGWGVNFIISYARYRTGRWRVTGMGKPAQ